MTGIGTGVGKTLCSAIVVEALKAHYWKPVQAGLAYPTDSEFIGKYTSIDYEHIYNETYRLFIPASPHVSARRQRVVVKIDDILQQYAWIRKASHPHHLVIEGAGGVMVPLNEAHFMIDLMQALQAKVIIVSKNYLGSINHSMMTAETLIKRKIPVLGWIFNGDYRKYEEDIVRWSGFPKIGRINEEKLIDQALVRRYARRFRRPLQELLSTRNDQSRTP